MKKSKRILSVLFLAALLISTLCVPAFALTESEVQAQVAATSREAVTGNVLIWFLCAVAFLKVSQKIDSIMASLGVNVGRTGGSMLAEAMIAMRAVTMVVSGGRGAMSGRAGAASGSPSGSSGGAGMAGFFKGGVIGMAGRHITNSAVRTATTQTSAVHTAQSQAYQAASAAATGDATETNINNAAHSGGSSILNNSSTVTTGVPPQDGGAVPFSGAPVLGATMENIPFAGSGFDQMPPQDGAIVPGSGESISMGSVDSSPYAGSEPEGMPPQDGVIVSGGGELIPTAPIENAPFVNSVPDSIPPQDSDVAAFGGMSAPVAAPYDGSEPDSIPSQNGGVVTFGGVSVPAASMGNAPSAGPAPNGMPPQEGVIVSGSGMSAPVPPVGNVPPVKSTPNSMPPQDGAVVSSGRVSTPAASMENVPPAGLAPDGIPPQEGIILTGSETPPSIPAGSAPQLENSPADSTPSGGMPAEMTPPEGGAVITGGNTTIQASQTENTTLGSPVGSKHQAGTAGSTPQTHTSGNGGGQHTQSHTEQVRTSHTSASSERVRNSHSQVFSAGRPTLGGMVFSHSLASGGSFANDVIGKVARGEVGGSITGDMAVQSLQSYLGYTAQGSPPPVFTDTEIGRGRITGQVSTPEHPQPIAFGLYHTEQYAEPKGEFTKIRSADGTLWYSQMAQDTVERKPYKAPDGTVAYQERIVKKLPDPPKRKDRI